MTIKWGDPIECNGVRPDWLRDDEPIVVEWHGGNRSVPNAWTARSIDAEEPSHSWAAVGGVLLPADHPAYVALARGFTPWSGGDSAPDDWDGGKCLARSGRLFQPVFWSHPWNATECGVVVDEEANASDVIGYRKRNTRFDEPHLARIEVEGSAPVDGVFIKRMTPAAIVERWTEAISPDGTYDDDVVEFCRRLGLVQDETLAERFTRETGHAVTEAVEAALNWDR